MRDKFQWSPGTIAVIFNKSNPHTAGKADYTSTVDAVLTDVNTSPNNGKNPGDRIHPTSWEYSIENVQRFTGKLNQYYPAGVLYNSTIGVYGSDPLSGPAWDRDSLYNHALDKLNSKVRDQADWAEDISQAKATAKSAQLGSLAKDLVEAARNLRRNPLSLIGASSGAYLQFRYAWNPLLNNIYDTACAALNTNGGGLMSLHSGSTQRISSSGTCVSPGSGSSVPGSVRFSNSGKQGCKFHIIMRGMDENRIADFSTMDPRVLAWNLLPWSFVVDWVYSVGGYLEAQEHALRFNPLFVSGYVTELYACYRRESIEDMINAPRGFFVVAYGQARRRSIRFKRTALTSWPLPRRPVLKMDLGSGKLLAAAALLGSLLGRKH